MLCGAEEAGEPTAAGEGSWERVPSQGNSQAKVLDSSTSTLPPDGLGKMVDCRTRSWSHATGGTLVSTGVVAMTPPGSVGNRYS